jgi:hypothetical protein
MIRPHRGAMALTGAPEYFLMGGTRIDGFKVFIFSNGTQKVRFFSVRREPMIPREPLVVPWCMIGRMMIVIGEKPDAGQLVSSGLRTFLRYLAW